jgi:hypothetical protein
MAPYVLYVPACNMYCRSAHCNRTARHGAIYRLANLLPPPPPAVMVVFVHACAIHVPSKPLRYAGKIYTNDSQFHALDGRSVK